MAFDLQGPAEIDIALRKGNLYTLFAECGIDGVIDVADHVRTPVDIADDGAQLEIERTVTESQKQHAWIR